MSGTPPLSRQDIEPHTPYIRKNLVTHIVIGSVFATAVILSAIPMSSLGERAGLAGSVRMDLLFLSTFLAMVGVSFLFGMLGVPRMRMYLQSHLDDYGGLSQTKVLTWVERSATNFILGVFGLGWLIQNECEQFHVPNSTPVLPQIRDCYLLTGAMQSVLIGCYVGLLLALYWMVWRLEKERGVRIYLQKPIIEGWRLPHLVMAIGFAAFLMYVFYKIFTLGR